MFKEEWTKKFMEINRIVSFLPSATELIYELQMEERLFGVTHECRYPENAKTKPKVITSVINSEELTSNQINSMTCQLLNDGKDIFILDEKNIVKANPDLIISQETCEVCAAYTNQVSQALKILKKKPMIHSMDPHNIQEILDSVKKLGKILKKEDRAQEIINSLIKRIEKIKKNKKLQKPKILAIEWMDPFFTAGHWVPEMIEMAGGINLISKPGEHSRNFDFQEIRDADPDMVIIMSCGFNTKRIVEEYNSILKENQDWNLLRAVKNRQIFAVDANSFFSKPSIRTIEGIEVLARIIQPENFQDLRVPEDSFEHIK